MTDPTVYDHPSILKVLFWPRRAAPGQSDIAGALDGQIPAAGASLGYRLYPHTAAGAPAILFFHGNGEIAPDYDDLAPFYRRAGASLLVVDYRGYGWSTGQPLASTLLSDAESIAAGLPAVLEGAGLGGAPILLMGRSLGSIPAIHLAERWPGRWRGLIVESGLAHLLPVLAGLGAPVERLAGAGDPAGNADKMARIGLPLLVIHGEEDGLIPVAHGQALYDASPAALKRLLRLPGADHNDLLFRAPELYFNAVTEFLQEALAAGGGPA